jgi:hypothetical protein
VGTANEQVDLLLFRLGEGSWLRFFPDTSCDDCDS